MDNIVLKIPKKSEYISTIRLTTSALANLNGFNIDEISDIKVIISEICTFFMRNTENSENSDNSEDFEINYQILQDKMLVSVRDLNEGLLSEDNLSDDMSIMIIESLSDNYDYDLNNKTIKFEKIK